MRSSESIKTLAPALVKALSAIEGVKKDSKNPHFKNDYASLEAVIHEAKLTLPRHGLAFMQGLGEYVNGAMTVSTRIIHESGEWIESDFQMPVAKSDPQGTASASTYARRYSLMSILGIPAVDDDGEAATRAAPAQNQKRDTGPAPVEGKDFWKCEGPGMTAYAAKNLGLEKRHEEMREEIGRLMSAESWREWCSDNQPEINTMPPSWRMLLRDEAEERGRFLGTIND